MSGLSRSPANAEAHALPPGGRGTILTTYSGREVDLFAPRAGDIDFGDIAAQLAKENRYNGATPQPYSVAEHLVRCADAALAESGGVRLAGAYALTHDFHEAYLKDDTTPKKRALGRVAARFGAAAGAIDEAFAALTGRFDVAIHEAAGLAWPPSVDVAGIVERVDRRMLVTEWLDLRPGVPLPAGYSFDDAYAERIRPWRWNAAEAALCRACLMLLPALGPSSIAAAPVMTAKLMVDP